MTAVDNAVTTGSFSLRSFEPPCVVAGGTPANLTCTFDSERREWGINLPSCDRRDVVHLCGSVSGRDGNTLAGAVGEILCRSSPHRHTQGGPVPHEDDGADSTPRCQSIGGRAAS